MDMNNQVENPYEQLPQDTPSGEQEKKKPGFGKGMFIGILTGMVGLALVAFIAINIYCSKTGYPLMISPKKVNVYTNDTILDKATSVKMDEIMQYINLYYDGEYDADTLRNDMLDGLVAGLGDKYAAYYTPEEYEQFQTSTTGSYFGIGAGLKQDEETKKVTISKIYDGTPSQEAGLQEGDQIISADDVVATETDLSSFVQVIRGEEGTTVHLEVYRESSDETLSFDVERKNVVLPSVASQMLEKNIGYIQISEFQSNTSQQFQDAYNTLEENGMEYLIVDLRENPGGLLSSVTNLLDFILPEGTTVSVENKYGFSEKYTSDAGCISTPMVVLVDENSASAAEIFAGAIKDYNYGTLLGTTTFGKGIVQSIYTLSDGDALKLTTAKYYTPKGNYIHGVGITPDVELEYQFLGEEGEAYSWEKDNQIQAAIELLLSE